MSSNQKVGGGRGAWDEQKRHPMFETPKHSEKNDEKSAEREEAIAAAIADDDAKEELAQRRLRLIALNIEVWEREEVFRQPDGSPHTAQYAKLRLLAQTGGDGRYGIAHDVRSDFAVEHGPQKAADTLAVVQDALVAFHQTGMLTERQRDHFLVYCQSTREDDPHPESGLPCHCGEKHALGGISGVGYSDEGRND